MKSKFLIAFLLGIAGCFHCNARYTIEKCSTSGEKSICSFSEEGTLISEMKSDTDSSFFELKKKRSTENKESQPISIDVKMIYPQGVIPCYVSYGQDTFGQKAEWNGEDEFTMDVYPYKNYPNLFLAIFEVENSNNVDEFYVIARELESLENGVSVIFDASDAEYNIAADFLKENGEQFSFATYDYDPITKTQTLRAEGDMCNLFGTYMIFMKDEYEHIVPLFDTPFFMRNLVNIETGKPFGGSEEAPIIHCNKFPDYCGLTSGAIGFITSGEKGYILQTNTIKLNSSQTLSNDINLFKEYNTSYVMPNDINSDLSGTGKFISLDMAIDNWFYLGLKSGWDVSMNEDKQVTMPVDVEICIPLATMEGNDIVQAFAGTRLTEVWESGISGDVLSRLILPINNGFEYVNYNTSVGGDNIWGENSFLCKIGSWVKYDYNEFVNPYLPSNTKNYLGINCNSTPLLCFQGSYSEGPVPPEYADLMFDYGFFKIGYNGRNCENRYVDYLLTNADYENNNNMYVYNFINDLTLIDGEIEGINNTILGCNFEAADFNPPTVQYLMFFNESGDVIDRFEKPSEGRLGFYAGDFYGVFNEDFTEYQMDANKVASIKVEYAPYGTSDFTEIPIEEDLDKYFMPGFGYYYTGSLEGVSKKSDNRWFDIRFTLYDETGNYQIQTLSPAFKIMSNGTNVNGVMYNNVPFEIVGRNIIVPEDASIYNLDGILSNGVNVAPGIYIVKHAGEVCKVVIK